MKEPAWNRRSGCRCGRAMLDDPSGCAPFIETMRREKLDWVATPAVDRFDGFPPMAQFGSLLEEYCSWKRPT